MAEYIIKEANICVGCPYISQVDGNLDLACGPWACEEVERFFKNLETKEKKRG